MFHYAFWAALRAVFGEPSRCSLMRCVHRLMHETQVRTPKLIQSVHKPMQSVDIEEKRDSTVPHPLRHFLYRVTEQHRPSRWTLLPHRAAEAICAPCGATEHEHVGESRGDRVAWNS